MNKAITSREKIMQVCRNIAAEQGLSALNMRAVAGACGIALGTLYNYYSGKDELLLATVESVWMDIFHMDGSCQTDYSFPEYIRHLFGCARKGAAKYPNFLTAHSLALAGAKKDEAKSAMERNVEHIKGAMLAVLCADPGLKPEVFSAAFSQADFIDFVLDNILLLIVRGAEDCTALTELVRRVIYG